MLEQDRDWMAIRCNFAARNVTSCKCVVRARVFNILHIVSTQKLQLTWISARLSTVRNAALLVIKTFRIEVADTLAVVTSQGKGTVIFPWGIVYRTHRYIRTVARLVE